MKAINGTKYKFDKEVHFDMKDEYLRLTNKKEESENLLS